MNYCVQYYKNFRYNDIVNELIFFYNDNIVDEVFKLVNENQRIIIDVTDTETDIMPMLNMCKKIHSDIAVRVNYQQEQLISLMREAGISFFYDSYVTTVDEIYGLVHRGVSDIYITESAGFKIAEYGRYCRENNVKVRMIPNIAQYKVGFRKDIPDPCKFFIRPEDVDFYEPFVDVLEISAPDDRLSVIYEIYRNKEWLGDLKDLIVGFEEPFHNSGLVPYFGQERLKCGQRCMIGKCNLCQHMKEIAYKFKNNNLEIERTIDKEWKNETKSHKEAMQIIEKSTSNGDGEVPEE